MYVLYINGKNRFWLTLNELFVNSIEVFRLKLAKIGMKTKA